MARVRRLDMEVQPRRSREGLLAALDAAHESVHVEVAALMVLQVLFEFEGLPALWVLALENSVG